MNTVGLDIIVGWIAFSLLVWFFGFCNVLIFGYVGAGVGNLVWSLGCLDIRVKVFMFVKVRVYGLLHLCLNRNFLNRFLNVVITVGF